MEWIRVIITFEICINPILKFKLDLNFIWNNFMYPK